MAAIVLRQNYAAILAETNIRLIIAKITFELYEKTIDNYVQVVRWPF